MCDINICRLSLLNGQWTNKRRWNEYIGAEREKMFVKQIKRRFHYVHFNHHYWDASEGDWRDHQKNENLSQFSLIFPSLPPDKNHHCRLDLALFCVIERITNHCDVVECVRNRAWKWHVRFTQWKNVNFPFISHPSSSFFVMIKNLHTIFTPSEEDLSGLVWFVNRNPEFERRRLNWPFIDSVRSLFSSCVLNRSLLRLGITIISYP